VRGGIHRGALPCQIEDEFRSTGPDAATGDLIEGRFAPGRGASNEVAFVAADIGR
jgi:hypothetical protein